MEGSIKAVIIRIFSLLSYVFAKSVFNFPLAYYFKKGLFFKNI